MAILDEIEQVLETLAESLEVKLPYVVYDGENYDGSTYCRDCAVKEVDRLKPTHPEAEIEGGYSEESDGRVICDKCGVMLDYTLSEYGVEEELEYFNTDAPTVLTPANAYELLRVWHGQEEHDREAHVNFWRKMVSLIPTEEDRTNGKV